MKKDIKTIWLFVLSFGGLLFAGYLSGLKFFNDTCAFNESCPYFLGYPACYYGFAMYLALTVYSYLLLTKRIEIRKGAEMTLLVSSLGIVFAGYFSFLELPTLIEKGINAYVLGLPTCALGLTFYLLIFTISLQIYKDTYSQKL